MKKIQYFASEVLIQCQSGASYMHEINAKITAVGHPNNPIVLNREVYTICTILNHLIALVNGAKLDSVFLNTQRYYFF